MNPSPDPPSLSPHSPSTISNASPIRQRPLLSKAASRESPREQLRKTATLSNASQAATANNVNHPQKRPSSRTNASVRPPARVLAPAPARDRTRPLNPSQHINRGHRERGSSTEYQSSGDSSDTPLVPKGSPRRSHRARNEPQTYNVRALVGLELEPSESSNTGVRSRATSERASPKPPHTSLVTSNWRAPQTPQEIPNEVSSDVPDFEGFLLKRQRGRFTNNGYYEKYYADRLSKLAPGGDGKVPQTMLSVLHGRLMALVLSREQPHLAIATIGAITWFLAI